MQLEPFLLDRWLNRIEGKPPGEGWDLASSTGPRLTLRDLLGLVTDPLVPMQLLDTQLSYPPMAGSDELRAAIAAWEGVSPGEVHVVTGAAEALLILFVLAAERGANVVLPRPDFPAMTALARGFGLEVRHYALRPERAFQIDPEEVAALCDDATRMVLVISPHNPTGAVIPGDALQWLHDFCVRRGVQFVCDQVYHPIYHGAAQSTAARLPGATVIGDCSKALCLSGLRVGWLIERDAARRERALDARGYFTISNNVLGEVLAVQALQAREGIFARAQKVAAANLALLDDFFTRHADRFGWVRPQGGFTAFPWLVDGADSMPLCMALEARGVGVVPGICMNAREHLRIGFGASGERFGEGLAVFDEVLQGTRTEGG